MSRRCARPARAGVGRGLKSAAVVATLVLGLPGSLPAGASTASGARVRNGLVYFDRTGTTRGDIFAIRPNHSGFHRVVRNGLQPSVSNDGHLVAFQGESSRGYVGGYNLAVVQPDGSHRRGIRPRSEAPEYPSFSPDDTSIVFDDGARGIWVVNTDGSHLRRIASFKARPSQPEFAPDGQSILFVQYSRRTGS